MLLDGAQGLGAVPVDVRELGCDFYAASGQKWLCGPIGSGYLYVRADRIEELSPIAPGYGSLADPKRALELDLRDGRGALRRRPAHHPPLGLGAGRDGRAGRAPGWTTCTTRGPSWPRGWRRTSRTAA